MGSLRCVSAGVKGSRRSSKTSNEQARDAAVLAQSQRLAVSGQLEIAAPDGTARLADPHRAFPIDRTRREASVVLLVVEEGFEIELSRSGADTPLDGVANCGARRDPGAP